MRKYIGLSIAMILVLLQFSTRLSAQTVSDCKIFYKINLSGSDMDPMAKMLLGNATMNISFLGDKSRVEMNMMSMMKTVAINDEAKNKSVVLTDMMGKKIAMIPKEEDTKASSMTDNVVGDPVKTGKTKQIAGLECTEYVVKTKEGETMSFWYTDKIQPKGKNTDFSLKGVKGFPLEMDLIQEGMKMKMTATKISLDKLDPKNFVAEVPAGYEIKTQEEMMEDMGGAAGKGKAGN